MNGTSTSITRPIITNKTCRMFSVKLNLIFRIYVTRDKMFYCTLPGQSEIRPKTGLNLPQLNSDSKEDKM